MDKFLCRTYMDKKERFIDKTEPLDISIREYVDDLWCRKYFDCRKIHSHTKGKGVKVAVLDTGKPLHEDIVIRESINFTNCNDLDIAGHSTHVCGIIACREERLFGIAPDCDLYVLKVLDDNGLSSFNIIYNGLAWCLENDIDVINMSLGSIKKPYNDKKLIEVLEELKRKGVVCCAASGNDKGKISNFPAQYANIISVGGICRKGDIESWCNGGFEITAPSSAYSTYLDGKYARLRGTSQSTAFISGLVALIKSVIGRKATLEEIRRIFKNHMNENYTPSMDSIYYEIVVEGGFKNE